MTHVYDNNNNSTSISTSNGDSGETTVGGSGLGW